MDLESTYHRPVGRSHDIKDWDDPNAIRRALEIVVHSAYHLGEIR